MSDLWLDTVLVQLDVAPRHGLQLMYSLDQMPWLLFISSRNFVQLLFESGYYLRAVLIELGTEDEEIHCPKQGGVAADARESIQRDTATLATVTDTEFEESDSCTDVESDKTVSWRRTNLF